MEERKEKGLIENLRPRTAFKVGLLSGLAVMFVIGFFILLGIMLSDSYSSDKVVKKTGDSPTAGARQPSTNIGSSAINIEPVTKDDWLKGNREAKISIIEFSDLECPFCKRFHPTMQQILDTYGDKVNWVYRHFPLTQLHSKAVKEAEATECAGEQGGNKAFWAYTDRLFEITPSNNRLEESQLSEIASYVGLDIGKFQECLESGKYTDKIQDHIRQAQAAGGRGTPYSIIVAGDAKVPINGALPFEQVKSMLDSLIN